MRLLQTAEHRAAYRASLLPKNAIKDERSSELGEAYTYEMAGALYGIGFRGTAGRSEFHYRFRSSESRQKHIDDFFMSIKAHVERKAEYKAKKQAFKHSLQVGDVLRCSWGYDQTNIDYYQVTELCGKHVVIREIAAQSQEDRGWVQGSSVPALNHFTGEPMRKLVQEGNAVRIASYACAYKLEPKAEVAGMRVYEPGHWTAYA